tara:strand:+ start:5790 stop:6308 length:519 start_codon:yes stop_codon:yes gene_type:complete
MIYKKKNNHNNIVIKSATEQHIENIVQWLQDKNVKHFLSSNLRSRSINNALIKVTLKRPDQSWNIIEYKNEIVGLIVLDNYDNEDKIANIWYLIGKKEFQNKSIMSEALKIFVQKTPLNLDVVTAWVGSNNIPSIKCLEKAEFRRVGHISNAFKVDGVHSRVIFEKIINRDG